MVVNSDLISLPNYICGEFKKSDINKVIQDYHGSDHAVIYSVSEADLRHAKRMMFQLQDKLKNIPIKEIIRVIKKSMEYYFVDNNDVNGIVRLTGCPISFLLESVKERKRWCNSLETFLEMCFGTVDYLELPIVYNNKKIGIRKYIPAGPIIAILPRNSDEESLYVITQILLSRNVAIVKTSEEGCTNYSAIRFIQAINLAIDNLKNPELEILRKVISVVNMFGNYERKSIIEKLAIDNATYLLFGSSNTLRTIENNLYEKKIRKVIKMGNGLSVALVLKDADLELTAYEICEAASLNSGNECVGTKIVYVEDSIYHKFTKRLYEVAERFEAKEPLDLNAKIGVLPKRNIEYVTLRLKEIGKHHHLRYSKNSLHLSIVEIDGHHHFEEYPAPVLAVRRVKDIEDFKRHFDIDLERNDLNKNLVTSIFTKNLALFDKLCLDIKSHTIKLNKGTAKMNLMLEHAGQYLIKEFLELKLVEFV